MASAAISSGVVGQVRVVRLGGGRPGRSYGDNCTAHLRPFEYPLNTSCCRAGRPGWELSDPATQARPRKPRANGMTTYLGWSQSGRSLHQPRRRASGPCVAQWVAGLQHPMRVAAALRSPTYGRGSRGSPGDVRRSTHPDRMQSGRVLFHRGALRRNAARSREAHGRRADQSGLAASSHESWCMRTAR